MAVYEDLNNQLTDESSLLQAKISLTDEAIRQLVYDLIDGSVEKAASQVTMNSPLSVNESRFPIDMRMVNYSS
jgi:hypothetical protein